MREGWNDAKICMIDVGSWMRWLRNTASREQQQKAKASQPTMQGKVKEVVVSALFHGPREMKWVC